MASEEYWPNDLLEDLPLAPADILAEIASELGNKTKHLVEAKVRTSTDFEGNMVLSMILSVPALDGYQYQLLQLWHDISLYPVRSDDGIILQNEKELREFVKHQLQDEKTTRIIKALIAQAKLAPEPPPF